jgi:hypothetical protein
MKRLAALPVLVAVLMLPFAPPAQAGSSTDAALALGAFAVLNQILRGETIFHDLGARRETVIVRERVIVHEPPVIVHEPLIVHQPPTVIYAPAPPTIVYYSQPSVIVSRPYVVRQSDRGWKYYKKHGHHHDD